MKKTIIHSTYIPFGWSIKRIRDFKRWALNHGFKIKKTYETESLKRAFTLHGTGPFKGFQFMCITRMNLLSDERIFIDASISGYAPDNSAIFMPHKRGAWTAEYFLKWESICSCCGMDEPAYRCGAARMCSICNWEWGKQKYASLFQKPYPIPVREVSYARV